MDQVEKFIKLNKEMLVLISIILITSFLLVNVWSSTNYAYSANIPRHADKYYSLDEDYYARSIFIPELGNLSILKYGYIKHHLFVYCANAFAKVEASIFPNMTGNNHYIHVIILQVILTLIGCFFLFKIFSEIIKLDKKKSLLLSLIFFFSNAVLLCTSFIETFIVSGVLLILSYYFIAKEKPIIAGFLGAIVFGVTITNVIIWVLLVLVLNKDIKRVLITLFSFIISTLFFFLLYEPEYRNILIGFGVEVVNMSEQLYSDKFDFLPMLKRVFFFLGAAPLFYINTTNTNQLGTGIDTSISFIPSASWLIILLTIIWALMIGYALIKRIKDRNTLACLAVLTYTFLLHGIKQFGLKEAFLYSLHHLFAQIILVAIAVRIINKNKDKYLYAGITIFILLEIIINYQGLLELYQHIQWWKANSV